MFIFSAYYWFLVRLILYTFLSPAHVRVPMEISGFLFSVRRSNQSVLKEINPGRSSEGLIPKLKLQYFGPLMQRADSLEKILMLGETEGRRRRGRQRLRCSDSITDSRDMNLSKLWEKVKDRKPACAVHGVAKSQTWLSDWTTATTLDNSGRVNFWKCN